MLILRDQLKGNFCFSAAFISRFPLSGIKPTYETVYQITVFFCYNFCLNLIKTQNELNNNKKLNSGIMFL